VGAAGGAGIGTVRRSNELRRTEDWRRFYRRRRVAGPTARSTVTRA